MSKKWNEVEEWVKAWKKLQMSRDWKGVGVYDSDFFKYGWDAALNKAEDTLDKWEDSEAGVCYAFKALYSRLVLLPKQKIPSHEELPKLPPCTPEAPSPGVSS